MIDTYFITRRFISNLTFKNKPYNICYITLYFIKISAQITDVLRILHLYSTAKTNVLLQMCLLFLLFVITFVEIKTIVKQGVKCQKTA